MNIHELPNKWRLRQGLEMWSIRIMLLERWPVEGMSVAHGWIFYGLKFLLYYNHL